MKKIMKILMSSIFGLFLFTANIFSAQSQNQANQTNQAQVSEASLPKYKFFINPFVLKNPDPNYTFYTSSLPRSIRSSLSRAHNADFTGKEESISSLVDKRYDFLISGIISQKDGKFMVEFVVIYLDKNRVIIFADAKGYSDERIFKLIDNMMIYMINHFKLPLAKIEASPSIISISESGEIYLKDLRGADLSNRNLSFIELKNMILDGINFSNSSINGASFSRSKIPKGNFSGANARDADFSRTDLSFVSFKNADLRDAIFNFAKLYKTDFTDAKLSNQSDVNVGLIGASGAWGWFTTEGRIHKSFYLGIKVGYSYHKEENFKTLPILLTSNFYLLDKSVLERHLIRPFISIGLGYRFRLNENSQKGFIANFMAGAEFCLHNYFSLVAETGFLYAGQFISWTIGAGLKVYMPDVKSKRVITLEETSSISFQFIGVKLGCGMSNVIQKADIEISYDIKFKPFISYQVGIRFMYYPKGVIGFIIDADFVSLGVKQKSDNVDAVLRFHYLSLDAMFSIKLSDFFIGVGFYFAIPAGVFLSQSMPQKKEASLDLLYTKINFGAKAAFFYMFNFNAFQLFVGIEGKLGFTNIYTPNEVTDTPPNYRLPLNWSLMVNVGFGI